MGNNKRKKTAATAGAVVLVAALVLTGTYAWRSISQTARNENTVYANPGGRLHDDWNGETKMVYVENFTGTKVEEKEVDDGQGGTKIEKTIVEDTNAAPIYVRVKLQTYMEFGEDAGERYDSTGNPLSSDDLKKRNAQSLVKNATIDNTDSWTTYVYGGTNDPFKTYLKMVLANDTAGGVKQTTYMPTYNMNKESLMADINGKYNYKTGKVEGYQTWTDGTEDSTSKNAYYYKAGAGNKVDPVTDTTVPGTDAEYVAVETKHTAKLTETTAQIITMAEWLKLKNNDVEDDEVGNYWVYDEDGWAYWAQPLKKQTATGPLLNAVKLVNTDLGESFYYAVNVVGEFASAGDWGDSNAKTGFYKNEITSNAITLLNTVAKTVGADYVNVSTSTDGGKNYETSANNTLMVNPGQTVYFKGDVTYQGESISNQKTSWDLTEKADVVTGTTFEETKDSDGVTTGAKLVVSDKETLDKLTITVVSDENKDIKITYVVKIAKPTSVSLTTTDETENVRIMTYNYNYTYTAATETDAEVDTVTGDTGTATTLTFNATVKDSDNNKYVNQEVEWDVSYANGSKTGTKSSIENGVLTLGAEEPGTELVVTATSKADSSKSSTTTVTIHPVAEETLKAIDVLRVSVDDGATKSITEGVLLRDKTKTGSSNSLLGVSNNTVEVTIDGVDFLVLAKQNGKALLLAKYRLEERTFFDGSADVEETYRNRWQYSTLRTYLNGSWLSNKSALSNLVVKTTLKTLQEYDYEESSTTVDTTTDKVFLLSEADVFGTTGSEYTDEQSAPTSFYTVQATVEGETKGIQLVAPSYVKDNSTETATWIPDQLSGTTQVASKYWWWLRSPRGNAYYVANIDSYGALSSGSCSNANINANGRGGVRPALWIEL